MHKEITLRTFKGPSLEPYLLSITRLRLEIFRDYPYLYAGPIEQEMAYLKKHTQS